VEGLGELEAADRSIELSAAPGCNVTSNVLFAVLTMPLILQPAKPRSTPSSAAAS
jgi:hypothetical protein